MSDSQNLAWNFDARSSGANPEEALDLAAVSRRLALTYTDPDAVPAKYRPAKGKRRQRKKESMLEIAFQQSIEDWRITVVHMLDRLERETAWRFITSSPSIEGAIGSVVESADFQFFTDYLILRRDTERCGPAELGRICALLSAFQATVEEHVSGAGGNSD